MLSDPLLEQLRRLSRQTGVETSITHDAAEVRQKLRIHAPYGFFNELHLTTRTMFKSMPHAASAPVTPRPHDEPGLARAASTLPLPHVGHPVVAAAKADVAASGAFLTEPALDAEDEPADAPTSPPRLTPSPPAAPPVRTAVPVRNARPKGAGRQQGTGQQQGGGRPISPSGSPPKGNPFVKTTAGPAMTTSEQLRGGAMYLGDSNVLVASAAKYLAEVQESGADNSKAAAELLTSKVALPPSQTAVLSRVIASAERLALELAHAVVTATADSQKAVEAARLQALRSHIAGLRTVQQQCHHMQMMAEHRAEEMLKRLKVEERERKLKQQENSRLRWALSRGQVIDLKENAAMAFLEVGGAKNSKNAVMEKMAVAREKAAFQAQLDEALDNAEAMAKKLKEVREANAKKLTEQLEAAQSKAKAAMEAQAKKLEDELEAARTELELLRRSMAMGGDAGGGGGNGDEMVPPGGMIGEGGIVLDRHGKPVMGADGKPLKVIDPRVPPGGSIGKDGVILDKHGKPLMGPDGLPIFAASGGGRRPSTGQGSRPASRGGVGSPAVVPAGGSIGPGGVILDARGQPVMGDDGKPLMISLPPGGSIGPNGELLDANGRPMRGADGKPIKLSDPRVPPGGSIGPGGVILDKDGKPVLDKNGKPCVAAGPSQIPPGGSIGPGGVILDKNGKPVLGPDGKPMKATDPRLPPGGSIGPGGVLLDANGKPVLGADGQPLSMSLDPRVPPGGSIGPDGTILDVNGEPVVGVDGLPMRTSLGDGRIPLGGSVGPGGVILDASGQPLLDDNGNPMKLEDPRIPPGGRISADGTILDAEGKPVLGADGKPMKMSDPLVPPGGSIGEGGIILDANGKPVLGADGKPMKMPSPLVPPGGSIGEGGIILDEDGNPVLGPDGRPMKISDAKMPAGGAIGKDGIILDADGNPVLGADGKPLYAGLSVTPGGKKRGKKGGEEEGGKGKRRSKVTRTSEIVPAGRMVTISQLRCKDVPDMDRKGGDKNISDPYIIAAVVNESNGVRLDEARTPHIENARHPKWDETLRLFCPDDDVKQGNSKTSPVSVMITLMDKNKKKADELVGDVTIKLPVGRGKIRMEIPSRSVSSMRPFVFFRYETTAQMFFEQVEYSRVAADLEENAGGDGSGDELGDDDLGVRKENDDE